MADSATAERSALGEVCWICDRLLIVRGIDFFKAGVRQLRHADAPGAAAFLGGHDEGIKIVGGLREEGGLHQGQFFAGDLGKSGGIPIGGAGVIGDADESGAHRQAARAGAVGHEFVRLAAGGLGAQTESGAGRIARKKRNAPAI